MTGIKYLCWHVSLKLTSKFYEYTRHSSEIHFPTDKCSCKIKLTFFFLLTDFLLANHWSNQALAWTMFSLMKNGFKSLFSRFVLSISGVAFALSYNIFSRCKKCEKLLVFEFLTGKLFIWGFFLLFPLQTVNWIIDASCGIRLSLIQLICHVLRIFLP